MSLFFTSIVLLSIVLQLNGRAILNVILIGDEPIVKPSEQSEKKGLAFVREEHLVPFGIDRVSCRNWSDLNGTDCNAYIGDTLCTELRPVLCAKIDNSSRPAYNVYKNDGVMTSYYYFGWNRDHITTTVSVQGLQSANRVAVDDFCAKSFSDGWRMAEFHDGMHIPGMNGTAYAGDDWIENVNLQQCGG